LLKIFLLTSIFYINTKLCLLNKQNQIKRMFDVMLFILKRCTRLAAARNQVYQLIAHGRWFSSASSTTKTGRPDIAEILLKMALNTINQINQIKFSAFVICACSVC
jgi:hypothetical protein